MLDYKSRNDKEDEQFRQPEQPYRDVDNRDQHLQACILGKPKRTDSQNADQLEDELPSERKNF